MEEKKQIKKQSKKQDASRINELETAIAQLTEQLKQAEEELQKQQMQEACKPVEDAEVFDVVVKRCGKDEKGLDVNARTLRIGSKFWLQLQYDDKAVWYPMNPATHELYALDPEVVDSNSELIESVGAKVVYPEHIAEAMNMADEFFARIDKPKHTCKCHGGFRDSSGRKPMVGLAVGDPRLAELFSHLLED